MDRGRKPKDVFETETKYFSVRTDLNGKINNNFKLQVSSQSVTKQYYFWIFVCFTVYFNVCFLLLDEYRV